MPRPRRSAPTSPELPVLPFRDAEEAWFWFAHCQTLRNAGARFDRFSVNVHRPCDPDDIYRIAMELRRLRKLDSRHIAVLARFGKAMRAPDPRCPGECLAARLWGEAMDKLLTVFRAKGIVEWTQ